MGAWAGGPFDNDAAADFLDELRASPSRAVTKALRAVAKTAAGEYLEVDAGSAGWAAAELVSLSFGFGDSATAEDDVLDAASKLRPKEDLRLLALEVVQRIGHRQSSELASLWHEGADGPPFDAALEDLRSRLQAASKGPRELARPRPGDLIALSVEADSGDFVLAQVVGPREVALFEGKHSDDASAFEAVRTQRAHRVPAPVNKLLRRGRMIGNVPLGKDLRGKKLYASGSGAIEGYFLATASGGGLRRTSYEEAQRCDAFRPYDADALRGIALGTRQIERVKSPDEREAQLRADGGEKWAARRRETTPGPFGDPSDLVQLLQWMEDSSVENAIRQFHKQAIGDSGYGRPNEIAERRAYGFAGIVAIWRGTWPITKWPAELASRLPKRSDDELMATALSAARTLAAKVITRDAELRLIWDDAPDKGAELREYVTSLQSALAE
jgi:hypothetical protein